MRRKNVPPLRKKEDEEGYQANVKSREPKQQETAWLRGLFPIPCGLIPNTKYNYNVW